MSVFGLAAEGLIETSLHDHVTQAAEDGFTVLRRAQTQQLTSLEDLEGFQQFWDDLRLDEELADGGKYRYRRYGRLHVRVEPSGPRFAVLPHTTFRQDVIPLWQGKDRSFAPASAEALLHPGMRALVGLDAQLATALSGRTDWEVGVHLVRIVAPYGAAGKPTPEGRHRDGHLFVGMHLLRRDACEGGESTVFPDHGAPVRSTLVDPLDSMFVDDHRVMHEVSPIRATAGDGVRDMLLVDLNPFDPGVA
ncbi:2OG-Fe dioxygenase family protein [Actinoplanes sp. NEAU-A12]|uniref:2OG-Fe dioxygenase family protein n=1 Tax=Actinoplanes sandaracinus TaxID=3045177 RepID=A0ABT6WTA9_9ACTN|nr:2OG-Fe dioxygenase family protein [Actinoplanes sandaracinus]MDI6102987.1 2OG-Fe dioxygenase family protein [Actinoplanes sandaracinus]